MPSLYGYCMHTGLAHHILCRMCLHWGGTLTDMLIYVAIGKVGPCDEWLPLCVGYSGNANNGIKRWPLERSVHVMSDFHCAWATVATLTMPSTDETFLPWGSPYHSSHWIGRSTSGLRLCYCHRGDMAVRAFSLSSWWIVFELMNDARTDKIRAGSDLQHNIQYIYIYIYNTTYNIYIYIYIS